MASTARTLSRLPDSCRSRATGPLHVQRRFILSQPVPSRVSHCLPAARLVCRTDLPGVLVLYNGILALAPCGAGFHPRPGSALRFFQPLSGFPASSSSTALFHAATVPEVPPSERSPRRNRAPLSGPLAPLPLSTDVPRAPTSGLSRPVSADARDRSRLPGFPGTLWSSFQLAEANLPVLLAPGERNRVFRPLHRLRSFLPPASPFTTAWVAPPRRPLLSWTSALLKSSPPVPRILDPPHPRVEHLARSEERSLRREGPCDPSPRVGPHHARTTWLKPVGGFQLPSKLARTASRRRLLLPRPWSRQGKPNVSRPSKP